MEMKNKGNCHFSRREFAEVKAYYTHALKEDPTNIRYYSNLAAVHLEENDYQECIEVCKKAMKAGNEINDDCKKLAKVSARMGRAYMKLQNFKEAADMFEGH